MVEEVGGGMVVEEVGGEMVVEEVGSGVVVEKVGGGMEVEGRWQIVMRLLIAFLAPQLFALAFYHLDLL